MNHPQARLSPFCALPHCFLTPLSYLSSGDQTEQGTQSRRVLYFFMRASGVLSPTTPIPGPEARRLDWEAEGTVPLALTYGNLLCERGQVTSFL